METFDTSARIAVLENEIKNISIDLREHRLDSKEHHILLMKRIDNIDSRLQIIEKWRWMIVGAAAALGFLVSHLLK
jgi:hypothetical protein